MPEQLDLSYPVILNLFGRHAVKQRTESRQFLAWFLENYYHLEPDEAVDCICDDFEDAGVDGIYVSEQTARIDVFQSTIVKKKRTLGDALLKKFSGTLKQFASAANVAKLAKEIPEKELAKIISDLDLVKKVQDGYEVHGVFITNAAADNHAKAFTE